MLSRIREASRAIGRRAKVMEVCGTHTHVIARAGLKRLVREDVELISGPGCPVCVTSQRDIERMLALARMRGVTVATFGDMVRVPGEHSSLEHERAGGADVRVVYSPRDALECALREPSREVVFLAVGFETTAPAVAAVALEANEHEVRNFSLLASHKLIVPAMTAVLSGAVALDGFLTPGHVSVIIGSDAYAPLVREFGVPCVATGFEPVDVLEGLALVLEQMAEGRAESAIQYTRAVTREGNRRAHAMMMRVFEPVDAEWRGLGSIPSSGLRLREPYRQLAAETRFPLPDIPSASLGECRCGEVLKGLIVPSQCPLFGVRCTPRSPFGPCMVSSEGSCAATYRYE